MTADDYANLARHAQAATRPAGGAREVLAYSVAANPATILRLVTEVRDLREQLAQAYRAEIAWREAYLAQVHVAHVADTKVAAVEALSWELSPADGPRLRAVLSAAPTDTTKETP